MKLNLFVATITIERNADAFEGFFADMDATDAKIGAVCGALACVIGGAFGYFF